MVNNVPFTATHRQMPNSVLRNLWNRVAGGGGGAFVPVAGDERTRLMQFARDATKHIGETPKGTNILGDVENVHHALDIARLPDGTFKVIESNPTPGTLMNPLTARKLQKQVTGRWGNDVAAAVGLGAGATTLGGGALAYGMSEDGTPHAAKRPR